jgi:hypothetical protein
MLRFIDKHGSRAAMAQRLFHSVVHLSASADPGRSDELAGCITIHLNVGRPGFVIDQGLLHLEQQPAKMIAPVKVPVIRRYGFHADKRQLAGLVFQLRRQPLGQALLDLSDESRFTNTGRSEDQDQ